MEPRILIPPSAMVASRRFADVMLLGNGGVVTPHLSPQLEKVPLLQALTLTPLPPARNRERYRQQSVPAKCALFDRCLWADPEAAFFYVRKSLIATVSEAGRSPSHGSLPTWAAGQQARC